MIQRIHTFIFVFLASATVAHAQLSLNRDKCREMALEYSKQISKANTQKEKATYDKKAYRANYFPKLSATGTFLYTPKTIDYTIDGGYLPTYKPDASGQLQPNVMVNPSTGQPVIGSDGNPVFNMYAFMPNVNLEIGLKGVALAGLKLEQPIYMGGKIRKANEMAGLAEDMADSNIRLQQSNVIYESDKAYWTYLTLKDKVKAAKKYEKMLDELVNILQNSYTTGMSSRNNLLKAEVKKNEAVLMIQKAEHGRELARMNLCRIIGLPLNTSVTAVDSLTVGVIPSTNPEDENPQNRPDWQIVKKQVELKQKQVDLTRADFLPQLGASAGYNYLEGPKINGSNYSNTSFTAMASVKIPIFNWGEGRNKIRAAEAEQEMQKTDLQDITEKMMLEIAQARFNLKDAVTRLTMTEKALEQAKENLKESKDNYEVGMETLANYLEGQAQWQKALSDNIDAKSDVKLSVTQYLKTIGKLVPAANEQANNNQK
ncbi:membrane protein [Prolixibacter bellariivorans]|uniref:Membrane protein n=2 Tax=Prolixibacter bellariivorans TaxID=314319 RepID=A0A5M4B1C2_9BACT|nr:TolC family protein [Prolixibacter bellariivorans]GET33387.1 membrane protein [Prolixibacter bellariivorans]